MKSFYDTYRNEMMKIKASDEFVERMKREIPEKYAKEQAGVQVGENAELPHAIPFQEAKRTSRKGLRFAVAACLVLAVGLGAVFVPGGVKSFFSSSPDIVISDGIAHAEDGEQGMPITFRINGYGYDNEDYTTTITDAWVYFDFMFSCQGTEGDYVIYRFDGDGALVMTEQDYSGEGDFSWRKEIELPPGEVIDAHMQLDIPTDMEALQRELLWESTGDDYVEIMNAGIMKLNDLILVVECYKDGEIIKESSFTLSAEAQTEEQLITESGEIKIPVVLTAMS